MKIEMSATLRRFLDSESGGVAIEYGFIAFLIAIGIVGSLQLIAPAIIVNFDTVGANL